MPPKPDICFAAISWPGVRRAAPGRAPSPTAGCSEQELGDPRRVGAVPVHADAEGLDAAQHQPGVERAGDRAHRVLVVGQPLAELGVGDDQRAADDVGVPAEVLRRRVDDDVGAERQRLLQVGRGEGVVDDEQRARARARTRPARRCRRC